MVKFGKYLRNNLIEEWKSNYIDYKSLKQLINQTNLDINMAKRESEIILDNQSLNSSMDSRLRFPLEYKTEISPNSDYLINFLSRIDKEVKKIFRFYLAIEKELYIMINSICIANHNKSRYRNF